MIAAFGRGLVLGVIIPWLACVNTALACACCTHQGQRNVSTLSLESGKWQQMQELRFGSKATLYVGEGDVGSTEGIATPSATYALSAKWQEDRLVLSFRDAAGRAGTLSLDRPATVSIFEVDPRDRPDRGQGPSLYKEWKLSAPAAGNGVFSPGIRPRQTLTLVLQGNGNACTSAIDFRYWTLVMQGPKGNYTFYGDLVTPR